MLIREARKHAYFSHDVLSRRLSSGQSGITCLTFDWKPRKPTRLKVCSAVEHAHTQVDSFEQAGRVVG
jgi:hypothetical protein